MKLINSCRWDGSAVAGGLLRRRQQSVNSTQALWNFPGSPIITRACVHQRQTRYSTIRHRLFAPRQAAHPLLLPQSLDTQLDASISWAEADAPVCPPMESSVNQNYTNRDLRFSSPPILHPPPPRLSSHTLPTSHEHLPPPPTRACISIMHLVHRNLHYPVLTRVPSLARFSCSSGFSRR